MTILDFRKIEPPFYVKMKVSLFVKELPSYSHDEGLTRHTNNTGTFAGGGYAIQ